MQKEMASLSESPGVIILSRWFEGAGNHFFQMALSNNLEILLSHRLVLGHFLRTIETLLNFRVLFRRFREYRSCSSKPGAIISGNPTFVTEYRRGPLKPAASFLRIALCLKPISAAVCTKANSGILAAAVIFAAEERSTIFPEASINGFFPRNSGRRGESRQSSVLRSPCRLPAVYSDLLRPHHFWERVSCSLRGTCCVPINSRPNCQSHFLLNPACGGIFLQKQKRHFRPLHRLWWENRYRRGNH